MPGHGAAGGLDLPVRHPAGLGSLQPELAERDRVATGGDAGAATLVLLAVLDPLRQEHPEPPC